MGATRLMLAVLTFAGCAPPSAVLARGRDFQRGVALGLFGRDAPDGARAVDEIERLGASDLSLVITWVQDDVRASEVRADPAFTPSDEAVTAVVRAAHARGLRVTLFPILRLVHRTPAEWRGVIRPADEARWFASYGALLGRLARLANAERVERLCVGSELASLEDRAETWRALIARVRESFAGQLLYSANWDRYARVTFFDALDLIGVSAYWDVIAPGRRASVAEAIAAWRPIRAKLAAFSKANGRPLVLTEVGYPSVRGAGAWPWNDFLEGADGIEDAEAQRRLYEAFTIAFTDAAEVAGVYFWFWVAPGGPGDRGYSPRHKPAEWVIRGWFRPGDRLPQP
jgi:hypothetical protein